MTSSLHVAREQLGRRLFRIAYSIADTPAELPTDEFQPDRCPMRLKLTTFRFVACFEIALALCGCAKSPSVVPLPNCDARAIGAAVRSEIAACTSIINSGRVSGRALFRAYVLRAAHYGDAGQTDKAIADLNAAIAQDSSDAEPYVVRALLNRKSGNFAASISDLDFAIDHTENREKLFFWRGSDYASLGQYDRAILEFDQALALNANDLNVLGAQALAYAKVNNFPKAEADLDRGIALSPGDVKFYVNRLVLRAKFNDIKGAQADQRVVHELTHDGAVAIEMDGLIALAVGDYDQAVHDETVALAKIPNDAAALYYRGMAKQRAGDLSGAASDMAAARMIDSDLFV